MRAATHLSFGETQRLSQLFPFGADDVMVFLEGVFQFEQLARTERRPYSLRFSERL
jgi:hypothetical protein